MNKDYKMKEVLILKCKTEKLPERRVPIKARIREYKGHKFLIQGIYDTGYSVGDFETGMGICGTSYPRLKNLEENFTNIADKFIGFINSKPQYYQDAIDRFNKAPIMEE